MNLFRVISILQCCRRFISSHNNIYRPVKCTPCIHKMCQQHEVYCSFILCIRTCGVHFTAQIIYIIHYIDISTSTSTCTYRKKCSSYANSTSNCFSSFCSCNSNGWCCSAAAAAVVANSINVSVKWKAYAVHKLETLGRFEKSTIKQKNKAKERAYSLFSCDGQMFPYFKSYNG